MRERMRGHPASRIATSWLADGRPSEGSSLRLFCFPYSGAGASLYSSWAAALPATIAVCPVQLPGRENRLAEPAFEAMAPLVREAAEGLLPFLEPPFAFFGHSMGALLSFELARHLRREHGLLPVHLVVSGHGAPDLPARERPWHDLPEAEFLERLRELGGMPRAVLEHAELRELLLPILRADFAVCETYQYRPESPLACRVTALGGLQDPYVAREDLAGWQRQTSAAYGLRMFPGGHFYLNTERALLCASLAKELALVTSLTSPGRTR